jgi:hypothetical protein
MENIENITNKNNVAINALSTIGRFFSIENFLWEGDMIILKKGSPLENL